MFRIPVEKLLRLAIVFAGLASSLPVFAQTGGLTGKATDDKGNIVVGYPLIIERQEIKGTYKTKTDKHGNYVYVGLPIGNYKITLQDSNGRTLFYITKHVGMGDPTEVNFDLAKEKALTQKEQQASPEVQKKLQEEAKEQKQFGGLKQLYDQGNALFAEKKYTEAAAAFEQAIPVAKDKNLPILLGRVAESYDKARQFDKATEFYQKAIQAKPDDAELHNGLGNVYAEMGKIPDAQQEFQKSAEINPANASRAYFNLGAIMYNTGKMDEAAAAFKKATDADPHYADAFFMQGRALMGKLSMTPDGKVVAAPGTAEALQSYLKLEPSGKYATEAQQMLQTIQGRVQTEVKVQKKKKG